MGGEKKYIYILQWKGVFGESVFVVSSCLHFAMKLYQSSSHVKNMINQIDLGAHVCTKCKKHKIEGYVI